MIDLMNLRHDSCRYMPVDGLFCGKRADLGRSWCAEHGKLVYTASRPRGQGPIMPSHKGLAARGQK